MDEMYRDFRFRTSQPELWREKRLCRSCTLVRLAVYVAAEALLARLYWFAGDNRLRRGNLITVFHDPTLRFYEEMAVTPGVLMTPSDWRKLHERRAMLVKRWEARLRS